MNTTTECGHKDCSGCIALTAKLNALIREKERLEIECAELELESAELLGQTEEEDEADRH